MDLEPTSSGMVGFGNTHQDSTPPTTNISQQALTAAKSNQRCYPDCLTSSRQSGYQQLTSIKFYQRFHRHVTAKLDYAVNRKIPAELVHAAEFDHAIELLHAAKLMYTAGFNSMAEVEDTTEPTHAAQSNHFAKLVYITELE